MDVEKTIEFILEQQAQLVVRLDRVEAHVEALAQRQDRTDAQVNALISGVGQQQGQITAILNILGTLAEAERRTQERLDALARLLEDLMRRGGDGARPN